MNKYEIFIDSDNDGLINEASDNYTSYLQLPFNITERANEAYDTASLTLKKLNRKEPFEPNSLVRIKVYDGTGILINDNEPYVMIVEEDNVESFYIGIRVYYTHNITLIENTKKLDYILLPNFSITNPKDSYLIRFFERTNGKIETQAESKADIKVPKTYSTSATHTEVNSEKASWTYTFHTGFISYDADGDGDGTDDISEPIFYIEEADREILTNYPAGTYFTFPTIKRTGNFLGLNSYYNLTMQYTTKYSYTYNIGTGQTWFRNYGLIVQYRVNNTTVAYGIMNMLTGKISGWSRLSNKFIIEGSTGKYLMEGKNDYQISIKILRPGTSEYEKAFSNVKELVKSCDPTYDTDSFNDDLYQKFASVFDDGWVYLIEGLADLYDTGDPTWLYDVVGSDLPLFLDAGDLDPLFQTSFIISSYTDATVSKEPLNLAGNNGKTVNDLLKKVISLIPEDEGKFSIASDNTILTQALPENVYLSRTVSEIMFDIGKLTNTYPYLRENNSIIFKHVVSRDNPNFEDDTEIIKLNKNIDDSVSTYITDIKNMINDRELSGYRKHYSYWPSRNGYEYMNGDQSSYSLNPDNCGITISGSNGIYELVSIKVSNCLTSNMSEVVDITDFCPEKSVYDTFYTKLSSGKATNRNKNNCIYWTKNSNFININKLTSQEAVSIYGGDAPTAYAIENAIKYAKMESSNLVDEPSVSKDIVNYKFNITYIDSINGRIRTEKFNSSNNKTVSVNYNQDVNNVSSIDWGSVIQNNILRRGNLDLTKTVNIKNLVNLPKLGEIKIEGNNKYLADVVSYVFDAFITYCTLNYTKDYNKIDGNISIYKDYREFEIYDSSIVDRDININKYIYMDTVNGGSSSFKYTSQLVQNGKINIPTQAIVFFKDKNKSLISYKMSDENGAIITKSTSGFTMPLSYVATGNNITFKTECMDNYALGYYPDSSKKIGYYNIFGTFVSEGDNLARLINEARYVDNFGEAKYVSFYIMNPNSSYSVPLSGISEASAKANAIDYIEDKEINKDNREKLRFIYQVHFLTKNNIFKWSPALCKYIFKGEENSNILFTDNGTFTDEYLPRYVGIKYDVQNRLTLEYQDTDILFKPSIDTTTDVIKGGSFIANSNYIGYALVFPKTRELIYHVDKVMNAGSSYTISDIYFNYFNKKQ